MSRSSFASFHLTGIKPSSGKLMTSSVDRLFENENDVFISSNYNDFNQVSDEYKIFEFFFSEIEFNFFQALPSIQEAASVQSKSPEPPKVVDFSFFFFHFKKLIVFLHLFTELYHK